MFKKAQPTRRINHKVNCPQEKKNYKKVTLLLNRIMYTAVLKFE
jgi:hypothetical protein